MEEVEKIKRPWVTFFSQTGSEIYNIIRILSKVPDVIVTNKPLKDIETINLDFLDEYGPRMVFVSNRPEAVEYMSVIPDNAIVTLHGWLRIVPPEVCEEYEIYNLHPAPLLKYPHLKGKDPQIRTFNEKLEYSGNTIHKCIAELDAGPVLAQNLVPVKGFSLDEIFEKTHKAATDLWVDFLKEKL
jgi:folate-dependent phosphoribosylglycinamide formyltransferase PurN